MPIVNTKNTTNPDPITPDRKLYTNPEFKTSTLFNEDQELNEIIQYVEGGKWTVDFFQQIREINTTGRMPDINVPAPTLSYNRINKLILNIDSGIDQSDPNDITGTCSINAGFMPSYGDVFIATLTGGREAMFVITEVNKKMYSLHEMYEVNFKLHEFFDKNSEAYRDLLLKVIKEYTYDVSHIADKSAPIILSKDLKDKVNLKIERSKLVDFYFTNMFNKEKNTLLLPTKNFIFCLDTMLTEFILKLVGLTGYPNATKINRFHLEVSISKSIYDVVLDRDISSLNYIDRDIGFRRPIGDGSMPVALRITWLGIDYIVDKVSPDARVSYDDNIKINGHTKPDDFKEPIKVRDNAYIFSNHFYDRDIENCGIMELALLQFLRNEVVDDELINTMLEQYVYWDTIDQYYLIPFLILLVKDKVNYTFSSI